MCDPHRAVTADRNQRIDLGFFKPFGESIRYIDLFRAPILFGNFVGKWVTAIGRSQDRAASMSNSANRLLA